MPPGGHQLESWHQYLDIVEMQEDFDWAVKLYVKMLLIPPCCYTEFWMRNVEFMETKGGRELTNFALYRAREVVRKGLIYFLMMHGGLGEVNVVIPVIGDAVSPLSDAFQGLGDKDWEDISFLYLQGLIYFLMMHGGLGEVNVVIPVIGDAVSPLSDAFQGLGDKDWEDISFLYLQIIEKFVEENREERTSSET